ncbi:type I polyketide synthase [Paenibacillus jilunlii]|uniref:Acyl transferase domain-containing protein n=1 Tax=Paenibacillus jilunlii TaxID=682956 RepID=A0A1G9Y3U8_9BACL|nr:type I polyketide synthase [Paenibacillus jilunlii]SDN03115.1 Acyl transferase domain-containing protein [Paenibacillus jilunlii]
MSKQTNGLEIAVIGMSARFPGAADVHAFWDNLVNGKESITFFTADELLENGIEPAAVSHPDYVRAKGYLENSEQFDASFFDYSPLEAEVMDPQVRLFHECVWEALEDAGYCPGTYPGLIGLYAGAAGSLYWQALSYLSESARLLGPFTANQFANKDYLSTLISHRLNLKGPSLTVNTACSTSLVTIHLAAQALLNGECDIAVAGGASITMPLKSGYQYQEGMILSPDGHCKAFDEEGQGSVPGNGAGVVVLKRYEEAIEDGDHIYAVIKGSAVNNDGNRKSAYTAPSVEGQVEVIQTAQQLAEVTAASIQFVETHGTGTVLGDPIELEALKAAFGNSEGVCRIGSVKSNIGHLDAAAGVAGFIKAALSLQHKLLPPTLHFTKLNPKISLADSPFVVNAKLFDLSGAGDTLRAGVSSFGIGGTNAHIVLEEAPPPPRSSKGRDSQLILISAKSKSALEQHSSNLAAYLSNHPDVPLADLAYTLQVGRTDFGHRRFVVANHTGELQEMLQTLGNEKGKHSRKVFTSTVEQDNKPIVFMFPGLGNQYVDMGLGLYCTEPLFKQELDRCFDLLDSHLDFSVKAILFPQEARDEAMQKINRIDINQMVVFIFEYALGKYLMELGIKPKYMIGYSFGEFAAACLAGVFVLEDAIRVIIRRGQMIKGTEEGAMLSVPMTEEELRPLLPPDVSLSIVNGPSCVVGGTRKAVEQLEEQLKSLRQICIRLDTSYALHSAVMEPVRDAFTEEMKQIRLCPPQIPFISNLSGNWITDEEATEPGYWGQQLTDSIRFADGLQEILKEEALTFLEVGPDRNLSALLRYFVHRDSSHTILNLIRNPQEQVEDQNYLYTRLGQLWGAGHSIEWMKLYAYEKRKRLSLPTYPFERESYRLEGNPFDMLEGQQKDKHSLLPKQPHMEDWFYLPLWQQKVLPLASGSSGGQFCLLFANHDLISRELLQALLHSGQRVITVYRGHEFSMHNDHEYTIHPESLADYQKLFAALQEKKLEADNLVHLWSLENRVSAHLDAAGFHESQKNGFYSVTYIVQSLHQYSRHKAVRIAVVTDEVFSVTGQERLHPENAPLIGLGLVIPQEMQHIRHLTVDIQSASVETGEEAKQLAGMLLEELGGEYRDRQVSYRGFQRWVPIYQPIKLEPQIVKPDLFRTNGVYVLTGGAGMIGWIIAEHLAINYRASIAIIQRSFPVRQEWDKWLNDHPEDDPGSRTIHEMMQAEKLGANIAIYPADVSDYRQMTDTIEAIEGDLGAINGVIHCAANMGAEFFNPVTRLDEALCRTIFQPKVDGLLVLDQVLEDKDLDFCLLMSSTAAALGGYGFAAYSAASVFMDTYTKTRNKHRQVKWKSIDWEAWRRETKAEGGYTSSIGDLAMSPDEGIEALKRVLSVEKYHHLVHSPGLLDKRLAEWVQLQGISEGKPVVQRDGQKKRQRPAAMVEYEQPSNHLEKQIAGIWEDFLGIRDISIHDNFFELGATSLTLIRIKSILEETLSLQIPIVDLFANPTIAALARRIQQAEHGGHDGQEDTAMSRVESGRPGLTRQLQFRKSAGIDSGSYD